MGEPACPFHLLRGCLVSPLPETEPQNHSPACCIIKISPLFWDIEKVKDSKKVSKHLYRAHINSVFSPTDNVLGKPQINITLYVLSVFATSLSQKLNRSLTPQQRKENELCSIQTSCLLKISLHLLSWLHANTLQWVRKNSLMQEDVDYQQILRVINRISPFSFCLNICRAF